MSISAYPLAWPAGWKRIRNRTDANFSQGGKPLSIAVGDERVRAELRRMGVRTGDVIVSTDLRLRLDGRPYSDQRAPDDPGVAVYWRDGATTRVMAVDRYRKIQDNLAAVAATLDAMRAIERHGGAVILERAFTGFAALPPPGGSAQARPWREVFGMVDEARPDAEVLRLIYRRRIAEAHPDRAGGSDARAAELNLAYEQAKAELGFA